MSWSRIEWCDYSLNVLTGCLHECPYCYGRSMSMRFCGDIKWNLAQKDQYRKTGDLYILDEPFLDENGNKVAYPFGFAPTYHKYRLGELDRLKMGQKVFVGAMADLFGDWVPDYVVNEIMEECTSHPKNRYIFLTKDPINYDLYNLPDGDNFFYGTTVTKATEMGRLYSLPKNRKTFVSFEPLLEDLSCDIGLPGDINWIIVGAETGRRKDKIVPDPEWVHWVEAYADVIGAPLFMKDSLVNIVGADKMRQEFPEQMQERPLSDKITAKRTGACRICGKELPKKMMVTVHARAKMRGQSTTLGYMCEDCFKDWCIKNDFDVPDWEDFNEQETQLPAYAGRIGESRSGGQDPEND